MAKSKRIRSADPIVNPSRILALSRGLEVVDEVFLSSYSIVEIGASIFAALSRVMTVSTVKRQRLLNRRRLSLECR